MPFAILRYHIVLGVTHRRNLISSEVESFLYPFLEREIARCEGTLVKIGGIENHLHIANGLKPKVDVSSFVQRIKSRSTGAIRREFPALSDFSWATGYGAFTVNPFDMDRLVHYIHNQKLHHSQKTIWDDYEKLHEHGETFTYTTDQKL